MNLAHINKLIQPKKILDIGCNVGQFYKQAKTIWPNAYYYLMDGNESVEEDLKQLNVHYKIALLSDSVKTVNLYKNSKNSKCTGTSIYRETSQHYNDELVLIEEKTTVTLDSIFNENEVFDLIKIDTQGSEIDIINGGKKIFKNAKFVIMETSLIEWNKDSPNEKEVLEYMRNLGFEVNAVIANHNLNGKIIQNDILFENKLL